MIDRDNLTLELEWHKPDRTFGNLLGYKIKYGIKNQTLTEKIINDPDINTYRINDLGKSASFSIIFSKMFIINCLKNV